MVKIILILLGKMFNNEQFVAKAAESYPIRRAAQLFVYMCNNMKLKDGELGSVKLVEKLKKLLEQQESQGRKLK